MAVLRLVSESQLAEYLEQNPNIERLHLHSLGGRILAAKRMVKLIKQHRLDTYVRTECASACTLLFLAGQNKLLGDGGKLMFHASSIGSASGHENRELIVELEKAYVQAGLPRWFINKAINTPSDTFWIPENDELLRAKAVDRIVNPNLYAYSGIGAEADINVKDIEEALLSHDYMVAIKEYDPETFNKAIQINLEGSKRGATLGQVTMELVNLIYNERLPVYLANASDAAVVEYWQAQIFRMEELQSEFPLACASFVYPDEVPVQHRYGNEGGISEQAQILESKALAHLVKTHKNEQNNIDPETKQKLVLEVVERVKEQSEDYYQVVTSPADFVGQPDLMCAASIALNRAFISFDVNTSGQLLRSIHY